MGLGRPLYYFSHCFSTIEIRCATDAKGKKNKELGTVHDSLHEYIGTPVLLIYIFLLILFL
jgi:hypothetical protein